MRWSQSEHLRLPGAPESSDGVGGEETYVLFPGFKTD